MPRGKTPYLWAALIWVASLSAETSPWSVESFAFEEGYQERITGMVERFAVKDVMDRSKARSTCPDTGLPVLTWAVEGETIISPYTGRAYPQGNTGYFGPKRRNDQGQVLAFGGDPLKHTLMYATARMILDSDQPELKGFLGIPGNLRQQYHFAAVNWGRFWPLFKDEMGPEWNQDFMDAVAVYSEMRRPSDGDREHAPLRHARDLVGNPAEHLGGGGTENHRTMWRSAALQYAESFPAGALISGKTLPVAREEVGRMFWDYAEKLYRIGNGEYDSSIYYPYSLRAFLNLYDFGKTEDTRNMAKSVLDYYLATYGLKVFNGTMTGAQRRGYPNSHEWNDMDEHLWAWVGGDNTPPEPDTLLTTLHQVTSNYRPNEVITRLIRKEVELPFEAWINHPFYDMTRPGYHLEYYYQDREFSLGSVQPHDINNSGQQTTWVLALRGDSGETVTITGGQPRWIQRGGHSPYDQFVQHRNTLIYMMDQTFPGQYSHLPEPLEDYGQILGHLSYDRFTGRAGLLRDVGIPSGDDPGEWEAFLQAGMQYAGTFLWIPRKDVTIEEVSAARIVLRVGKSRVVIMPLQVGASIHEPDTSDWDRDAVSRALSRLLTDRLLVLPGAPGGFVMEVVEAESYRPRDFARDRLNLTRLEQDRVSWSLADGGQLTLQYLARELRPKAFLDDASLIPEAWAGRGHVDSPFLKIKDSVMHLTDGQTGYSVDVSDPWRPAYAELP